MKQIITILSCDEILDKAFRKVSKIEVRTVKGAKEARTESISRLNAFGHTISSQLQKYVKAFPTMDKLPPFHYALIDLQVSVDDLRRSLGALTWAAGQSEKLLKEYVRKVRRSGGKKDAEQLRKAAYGRISSVLKQVSTDLERLQEARKVIKRIPGINLEEPVVVIAGSPNVGKSMVIEKLTSAKPKIASYPFTTQEVSIGHLQHRYQRIQFMDTPGLLDRPLEERNKIERQAILAIEHLADIIVFIFDPSETCGYTFDSQQNLLEEIQKSFPDIPIITVANKTDILHKPDIGISISALKGTGIDELRETLLAKVDEILKED